MYIPRQPVPSGAVRSLVVSTSFCHLEMVDWSTTPPALATNIAVRHGRVDGTAFGHQWRRSWVGVEGAGTVLAERGRRRVYPIGQRSQHQEGISRKALAILTVCEVWPIYPVILRSGSTGWEGRVSKCARAGRVLEAVSPRLGHRHARAERSMRRGEARRTERQGSLFPRRRRPHSEASQVAGFARTTLAFS